MAIAEIKKASIKEFSTSECTPLNTLRTILLFGDNSSTYKFALLSALKKVHTRGEIHYQDIREHFVSELYKHYCHSKSQYAKGPNALTAQFDLYNDGDKQTSDWNDVLGAADKVIYNNVFDAFHNVGSGTIAPKYRLFEHGSRKRSIIATDNLALILESNELKQLLENETQARWRVVEEAWKNKLSPNLLEYNEVDGMLYSRRPDERVYLRSAVSVLMPYQQGRCFYCGKSLDILASSMDNAFPDVDHFLPLSLLRQSNIYPINPNGIWNLIIACKECNRGELGKFNAPPHKSFYYLLLSRNVLFAEEHRHSLKNSILISLSVSNGKEIITRMESLYKKFEHIAGWKPKLYYK